MTAVSEIVLVGGWSAASESDREACRLSGRRYLCCEMDAAMADRARARIASVLAFHDGGGA